MLLLVIFIYLFFWLVVDGFVTSYVVTVSREAAVMELKHFK